MAEAFSNKVARAAGIVTSMTGGAIGITTNLITGISTTNVAANDLVDGVFIGPSQTWYGRLPNTTVANLHAISSDIADTGDASATAIVCALIDDV